MSNQWKLLARCSTPPSRWGWTEMRVYDTPEGIMSCMAVVTSKQDTCDPQTYIHLGSDKQRLEQILKECKEQKP